VWGSPFNRIRPVVSEIKYADGQFRYPQCAFILYNSERRWRLICGLEMGTCLAHTDPCFKSKIYIYIIESLLEPQTPFSAPLNFKFVFLFEHCISQLTTSVLVGLPLLLISLQVGRIITCACGTLSAVRLHAEHGCPRKIPLLLIRSYLHAEKAGYPNRLQPVNEVHRFEICYLLVFFGVWHHL